jgi:tRNA G18 (ribose-2'-O)-methylase SpoU
VREPPTLVGDGIENPWNALTMLHAAGMFGAGCVFRDRKGLMVAWEEVRPVPDPLPLTSYEELARGYSPMVAFDNLEGAKDVYGYRLPHGPRPALVVGNERRGLAQDVIGLASERVQAPLVSRSLSSLNVAAASAVGLYYLSRGGGAGMQLRAQPERRRPELLMLGAADHWELGSSIRSAAAFGWERLWVEDRAGVWFGPGRITRSEGRSAARRGSNPIRVIPATTGRVGGFAEVCVITAGGTGTPLHRANLAGGQRQLIVFPDEGAVDLDAEDWGRLGSAVRLVHLDLPCHEFTYHYRLIATIALAEIARQVGRRARGVTRPVRTAPLYDSALRVLEEEHGETMYPEDLEGY